ncbi:MAG: hypothetical protein GEU96_06660 [Propionibacteriales bacterium]|nr:hypothetical protein [Propionibacteriales bacterium]
MSEPTKHQPDDDAAAEQPRRKDDPFGEVLPDRTRDETGDGWGERGGDDDDRLRREVPPHHG